MSAPHLSAIADSPHAAGPKAVFADWLAERGEPDDLVDALRAGGYPYTTAGGGLAAVATREGVLHALADEPLNVSLLRAAALWSEAQPDSDLAADRYAALAAALDRGSAVRPRRELIDAYWPERVRSASPRVIVYREPCPPAGTAPTWKAEVYHHAGGVLRSTISRPSPSPEAALADVRRQVVGAGYPEAAWAALAAVAVRVPIRLAAHPRPDRWEREAAS